MPDKITVRVPFARALPFATRDIDNRIAAGEVRAVERDHMIRLNAEALACSAHLRRMSVEDYVAELAPELIEKAIASPSTTSRKAA